MGTCDCCTTVTRMSRNSRTTVMRENWERCQVAGRCQAAGKCQVAAAAGRYHYVSNQSQFSFIGRQPLTKLSHISRTFWLTETKLRRIRDTPTTLWLCWEKICRAIYFYFYYIFFLEHVLKNRKFQRHVSETLRLMRGNWEHPLTFRDILETPSRMPFAISRQQPQPSEIGA